MLETSRLALWYWRYKQQKVKLRTVVWDCLLGMVAFDEIRKLQVEGNIMENIEENKDKPGDFEFELKDNCCPRTLYIYNEDNFNYYSTDTDTYPIRAFTQNSCTNLTDPELCAAAICTGPARHRSTGYMNLDEMDTQWAKFDGTRTAKQVNSTSISVGHFKVGERR